jgi:hypothetical protein
MTNRWDRSQTNDESESGLSNTLPGHRAGSPSLLTLMGPIPKSAAGFMYGACFVKGATKQFSSMPNAEVYGVSRVLAVGTDSP